MPKEWPSAGAIEVQVRPTGHLAQACVGWNGCVWLVQGTAHGSAYMGAYASLMVRFMSALCPAPPPL